MARAFVMAAGKGTRLSPLTDVLPKPAIPVANEPMMGRLLRLLARHGLRRVVANVSYLADIMEDVFGDGTAYGVDLVWSREPEPLGTAGGMRWAEAHLREGDEPVLVLSGDGLHDADITWLLAQHRASGALATIALARVSDAGQHGVAILDDEGSVSGFQEEPAAGAQLGHLASTGIYVLSPEVFDLLPPRGQSYDFGEQLWPRLIAEGGRQVRGVELPGYWNDLGDLDALRDGNFAVLAGEVGDLPDGSTDGPWGPGVLVHPSAAVAADAMLEAPLIVGPGAHIGAGARLSNTVVLPGAVVPDDALVAGATYGSATGLEAWAGATA